MAMDRTWQDQLQSSLQLCTSAGGLETPQTPDRKINMCFAVLWLQGCDLSDRNKTGSDGAHSQLQRAHCGPAAPGRR